MPAKMVQLGNDNKLKVEPQITNTAGKQFFFSFLNNEVFGWARCNQSDCLDQLLMINSDSVHYKLRVLLSLSGVLFAFM